MLFIVLLFPSTSFADDEENPEIEDVSGDARSYLDIEKAWFFENPDEPAMLYTVIQLAKPNSIAPKQHLTIHWKMNGEVYWTMCGVGYGGDEQIFYSSGIGYDRWYNRATVYDIEGEFNDNNERLVICFVPKEYIGNPQPGDVLTDTECQCFQRFGLWGRMGFAPKLRISLFRNLGLTFLQVIDSAPDNDLSDNIKEYGEDYIIKY
jgi:hypothetical protein